jgi:hypothetical protein
VLKLSVIGFVRPVYPYQNSFLEVKTMLPERNRSGLFKATNLLVGEDLITLKQASEESGFSIGYLRTIAQTGRLQAKKLGNNWLTTMSAIEEYKCTRVRIIKKV